MSIPELKALNAGLTWGRGSLGNLSSRVQKETVRLNLKELYILFVEVERTQGFSAKSVSIPEQKASVGGGDEPKGLGL